MFKAKPSFLQRVLLIGVLCMLLECLAIAVFAQAPKGKNKLSEAQQTKAEMFFFEGLRLKAISDYSTAIINFEKTIAIDPNQAAAYYELSQMHLNLKNPAAALPYAIQAIKFDPKNEWYLMAAAEASEKLSEYKMAEKYYQQLVKLKPTQV